MAKTKVEEPAKNSILAKFQCNSATDKSIDGNYQEQIYASAVTSENPDGSKNENESFSKWTPAGGLQLTVTNEAIKGFFLAGKEYLIEITPVEPQ